MNRPFPEIAANSIPHLTTEQMIEVDRAMIDDFHIELVQMMENAGRSLARLATSLFLDGRPNGCRVAVLAGSGGNGGGALVAARRLHAWGAKVEVAIAKAAEQFVGVPAHQLNIVDHLGITVHETRLFDGEFDLVLDGVIGYSLSGDPRGRAKSLIHWANRQVSRTLSLDVPSGVDTATGQVFSPAVKADATMTLALPKAGLSSDSAKRHVGELYLGDISVPPQMYRTLGLTVRPELFAECDIVRLA